MSVTQPATRPRLPKAAVIQHLAAHGVSVEHYPALLGIRGYYADTLGTPGQNDIAIYDDALFLVGPSTFASYNANTDPSIHRDGIATLVPGVWLYKPGIHHPGTPVAYPCLVQAKPVTVQREHGKTETGEFYIHIHRGGVNTTSSLGCQTIVAAQWEGFYADVLRALGAAKASSLPYVLIEQ